MEQKEKSLYWQMTALYRKESYPGKDIVLEMRYTDVGERYQILLGKDGSRVCTDGSLTATTEIETPVTVWRSIAAGEGGAGEMAAKRNRIINTIFVGYNL